MWIRYFIPEDGDDPQHPNVFKLPDNNKQSLVLSDIIRSFPIPGEYHFRFLKDLGKLTVWMDVVEPQAVVPTFQGQIFIKATRINEHAGDAADSSLNSYRNNPNQESSGQQSANNQFSNTSNSTPAVPSPPTRKMGEKLLSFEEPRSTAAPRKSKTT